MRAVTRAMLGDMPDPSDLHLERSGGRCLVMVGSAVLAEYAGSETVMRNFAVTVVRRAGFSGKRVAEVFGLSAAYVSTLHAAAAREGPAALVKHAGPGRPPEVGAEDLERARAWRAAGVSDREIGRRLGVAGTTVSRQLGPRDQAGEPQAPLPGQREAVAPGGSCSARRKPGPLPGTGTLQPAPARNQPPGPAAEPGPAREPASPSDAPAAGGGGGGLVPAAGGRIAEGRVWSRYAGAMLLYAFAAQAGTGDVLAAAARGRGSGARLPKYRAATQRRPLALRRSTSAAQNRRSDGSSVTGCPSTLMSTSCLDVHVSGRVMPATWPLA